MKQNLEDPARYFQPQVNAATASVSAAVLGQDLEAERQSRFGAGQLGAAPDPNLRQLVVTVLRRKWVIIWTVILITSLVTALVLQAPKQYTATAQVMIQPSDTNVVAMDAVVSDLTVTPETIQNQMQLLRSRLFLQGVVVELDLVSDPEFDPLLQAAQAEPGVVEKATTWASQFLAERLPSLAAMLPTTTTEASELTPVEDAPPAPRPAVTLNAVAQRLAVVQELQSSVISISFTSQSPEKAAKIANAIADSYVALHLASKHQAAQKATDWLSRRLEDLRLQVQRAEGAIQEYRGSNELVVGDPKSLREQIVRLSDQLTAVVAERAGEETRLGRLRSVMRNGGDTAPIADIADSALLVNLRQQQLELLRLGAELANTYGERHPRTITYEAEKANLERQIWGELSRLESNLESQVAAKRAREEMLSGRIAELEQEVTAIDRAQVELRELEREAGASRQLYEAFLNRYKEASEQSDLVAPDLRLVSNASVPLVPSWPRMKLIVAVAFSGSFLVGLVLVYLVEHYDSGFITARSLERATGLPTLALVPGVGRPGRRNPPAASHTVDRPHSAYAERLQALLTAITLEDVDQPPKVVLVTSSLPAEGKTTLAVSLARRAAQVGHKVLLLDGDLRRPSVHHAFDQPLEASFVEVLTGRATLEDAVHVDQRTNLRYMSNRPIHITNSYRILRSQQFQALLDRLRSMYDLIIVDSAPVLAVSDTQLLARLAEGVLFVVRAGKTKGEVVDAALRTLRQSEAPLLGTVLNRVDLRKHAKYAYEDGGAAYYTCQRYYAE